MLDIAERARRDLTDLKFHRFPPMQRRWRRLVMPLQFQEVVEDARFLVRTTGCHCQLQELRQRSLSFLDHPCGARPREPPPRREGNLCNGRTELCEGVAQSVKVRVPMPDRPLEEGVAAARRHGAFYLVYLEPALGVSRPCYFLHLCLLDHCQCTAVSLIKKQRQDLMSWKLHLE